MPKIVFVVFIILIFWFVFSPQPKAHWSGPFVSVDPLQTSEALPLPWIRGQMTVVPKARYQIKAVVLSKHHYWAGFNEDKIAPYDLALGWGPMSDAVNINALRISQGFRWYRYSWDDFPPLDPADIIRHSSNHHIIASDRNILRQIASVRRLDGLFLKGYLVDVSLPDGWRWSTSLTREDSGGGSCELFWVESVEKIAAP